MGSKAAAGAWQAIVAQMPPHDTYIEPFLGSGVVLRRKPPAPRSIGVDLDPAAFAAFGPPPRGVDLVQGDAVSFLSAFDFAGAGRVLVYADPPYVHATRRSRRRYRHEYVDADHVRLVELLDRIPAAVILSGYPSALYDRLLPDWRTIEFQVMTRGGRPATERPWMNYPADQVHWASWEIGRAHV